MENWVSKLISHIWAYFTFPRAANARRIAWEIETNRKTARYSSARHWTAEFLSHYNSRRLSLTWLHNLRYFRN